VGLLGGGDAHAALGRVALLALGVDPATELRLLCQAQAGWSQAGGPEWRLQLVSGTPDVSDKTMLALDADPQNPEGASDAAGACIVRNCDVLLIMGAVAGLAGSAQLATELGLPVLWQASGVPPRLLTHADWQWARDAAPEGEAAWTGLDAAIRAMLEPAAVGSESLGELLGAKLRSRPIWQAHCWAMNALWRLPAQAAVAAAPTAYWAALYDAADLLAAGYADRYRSSYTLVVALAAVALALAVLGLGLPRDMAGHPIIDPYWTAIPEAACLSGIIVLVQASARQGWQARMIAFRLLAELCRKQAALSFLARSLPASRISSLTANSDLGWAGRLFAAAVRGAPFPAGSLSGEHLAVARDNAAAILLGGQRAYHQARAVACRQRENRLVRLGSGAFVVTVVCVALKLGLLVAESERAEIFGLIAALLPAFAAAFFGVRAYAELELLVRHSESMITVLDTARASLERTDIGQPGAGQHIGDVLQNTAAAMLADVEGWIQISQGKTVEAG